MWMGAKTRESDRLSTVVHSLSTDTPQGCPHFCPHRGFRHSFRWRSCGREVDSPGTTRPKSVDRAVDNSTGVWIVRCWHPFIHTHPELSTETSPGCPHADLANDLRQRALSTQSTALTTTAEFFFDGEEKKKNRLGANPGTTRCFRPPGGLGEPVARGEAASQHALPWKSTRRCARWLTAVIRGQRDPSSCGPTSLAGSHPPAVAIPRAPTGSVVERMGA
jgi:hypothetical protein